MAEKNQNLSKYMEKLRQNLSIVKEEYSVNTLEVFGSYVRAEEQEISDLDILVTFSEIPGLFRFIALENHLTDLLGVKVDLVMKDALKPAIGERILAEALAV
jgi:uncharacterized protein